MSTFPVACIHQEWGWWTVTGGHSLDPTWDPYEAQPRTPWTVMWLLFKSAPQLRFFPCSMRGSRPPCVLWFMCCRSDLRLSLSRSVSHSFLLLFVILSISRHIYSKATFCEFMYMSGRSRVRRQVDIGIQPQTLSFNSHPNTITTSVPCSLF